MEITPNKTKQDTFGCQTIIFENHSNSIGQLVHVYNIQSEFYVILKIKNTSYLRICQFQFWNDV